MYPFAVNNAAIFFEILSAIGFSIRLPELTPPGSLPPCPASITIVLAVNPNSRVNDPGVSFSGLEVVGVGFAFGFVFSGVLIICSVGLGSIFCSFSSFNSLEAIVTTSLVDSDSMMSAYNVSARVLYPC